MARIELWNGDICDLEVDAIVNAANLSLWMSTGVGGEIKRAGGDSIEFAAVRQAPVALGEAVVTPAGSLAARVVVHAVSLDRDRRTSAEVIDRDPLVRTRLTTQQLLRHSGIGWDKIDHILLVGGSTHMPMTRQMMAELAGTKPDDSLAVSEVVARGAALHAGIVAARSAQRDGSLSDAALQNLGDVVEINVNSHSLGVIGTDRHTSARRNVILIPRNTRLPAAARRVFMAGLSSEA